MKGLIIKTTGSNSAVKTEDGRIINCTLSGRLRLAGSKSTSPVATGDIVEIEIEGNTGKIREICERKNYIIRKSVKLSKQTHVIAANIDQALLVITLCMPKTSTEFIDRYLCTAEAYRIPSVIIINKTDLYLGKLSEIADETERIYKKIGYKTLQTSVVTGAGIEDFRQLTQGKISLISGNSGVGKSSLLKFIEPEHNIVIKNISEYHKKGRHTTTFSEMYSLKNGGYIIDTPGIKGFGIVDINKEELFHFFPEIFRLTGKCQYYNCTHINEPNCAVMTAVESGEIAESRYISYYKILSGSDGKHRT